MMAGVSVWGAETIAKIRERTAEIMSRPDIRLKLKVNHSPRLHKSETKASPVVLDSELCMAA